MDLKLLNMADENEIMAIIEDAFAAPPWCDDWRDREVFHKYVTDIAGAPNSLTLGLYDGGELVALAAGHLVHWFNGLEFAVNDLCVKSSRRGSGCGAELVKRAGQYARENGIARIALKTRRSAPAYSFYRRTGFTEQEDCVYFTMDTEEK